MGKIKKMDRTGHTVTEWNPDVKDSTTEARRRFDEAVGENYMVFKFMGNPQTTQGTLVAQRGRVREGFDPNTVEYLFSPEGAGG